MIAPSLSHRLAALGHFGIFLLIPLQLILGLLLVIPMIFLGIALFGRFLLEAPSTFRGASEVIEGGNA